MDAGRAGSGVPAARRSAAVEASRQVAWQLAIDAAGIGTFDWDLDTGTLTWDGRLLELFGYREDEFGGTIQAFNERLHRDDLARVSQALTAAIESCGEYDAEYRVVLPDGRTRWVTARGRALCDETGRAVRVLGAAYDSTGVREADARVARVLESMTAAFFLLDRQWRFAYVNAQAERLLGRPREELLGGGIWELFPLGVGSDFETHYRTAMAGEPTAFEAYYPAPLDAWYEVQAWPDPAGLSVYFVDISARRAAQDAAERAALRAQLLAEVTTRLTRTTDAEEAVRSLADLVVPALADWCLVTLVDDPSAAGGRRGVRDVGWQHADPEARPLLERYKELRFGALSDSSYISHVLRTGDPVQVAAGATEAVQAVLASGEARELVGALAPESVTVLPLRGGGHTVGLLTLFNGPQRGALRGSDYDTALDVANRAGLALDSSRVYRQQRDLAEGLQRSLLTEPPEPDHVEVAVEYLPSVAAAQVGGDWYDAFLQRDGATVLVIGDVVGHDTASAAAMGQVRTLVRAVAAHSGAGPAEVLRGVDEVMETLQVGVTATAVVARVEQTVEERLRGQTRVRWSNAGHPPPIVVTPEGVSVLTSPVPDLLLGIVPGSERREYEVMMDRGATVLLYTDGLVERRGQSLDDGIEQLRAVLAEVIDPAVPLKPLCQEVLARMLPKEREDDVALVAVRLHAQDRPRPPDAGPNRVPPGVPDDPEEVHP